MGTTEISTSEPLLSTKIYNNSTLDNSLPSQSNSKALPTGTCLSILKISHPDEQATPSTIPLFFSSVIQYFSNYQCNISTINEIIISSKRNASWNPIRILNIQYQRVKLLHILWSTQFCFLSITQQILSVTRKTLHRLAISAWIFPCWTLFDQVWHPFIFHH